LLTHEPKVGLQVLYFTDQHQDRTTSGGGVLVTHLLQPLAPAP
jgi:hypothetical protein